MTGFVDKAKHALHLDQETKDPVQTRYQVDAARDSHDREEARADALAAEREADQRAHPSHAHTLEPFERTEPSSLARRTSLKAAAHGHTRVDEGEVTQPDLDGVTHIPESQLPERKPRMDPTALRPSDPNDLNSMDGAATYGTAGDDRAI
ncbi:hypothetical protein DMC30DRAFT_392516 [Rhodotorula diobovata]|uniref:Uncharacterized protein n=1 Tax=Rhodotorula diobovata TaxID=5288 RepID=A0A5C5G1J6_9BASI|nr:hypothetical protein DMC30DRAFT_392516 [Rhodotorula diobovata]